MNPDNLITGKVYFICGYEHLDKPIPHIRTLVYLGKNLLEEKPHEGDEYIFQDPQIYFIDDVTEDDIKKQILSESEDSGRLIIPKDCMHLIKSFDEMLEWLVTLRKAKGADRLY